MQSYPLTETIRAILEEAHKAHKKAFPDTEKRDPDWALWYAEKLQKKLCAALGSSMSKSELVYWLIAANRDLNLRCPGINWIEHFSYYFQDHHLQPDAHIVHVAAQDNGQPAATSTTGQTPDASTADARPEAAKAAAKSGKTTTPAAKKSTVKSSGRKKAPARKKAAEKKTAPRKDSDS